MPPQMPNTSGAGRACRLAVVLTVRKGSCIIMIRVIEIFLKKLACSVPVFVGASSVAALAVTRSSELTWIRQEGPLAQMPQKLSLQSDSLTMKLTFYCVNSPADFLSQKRHGCPATFSQPNALHERFAHLGAEVTVLHCRHYYYSVCTSYMH